MIWLDRRGQSLARRLQNPVNPAAIILVAVYTIIWGLWLLNPFWHVFNQAPLYSWLSETAPEEFWGSVAVVTGILMTYGIVRNSFKSASMGAFIGCVHWALISAGYFVGDWRNTGGITALTIAMYCGYSYLNIRVNQNNLPFENKAVNI